MSTQIEIDNKGLRNFGLVFGLILTILFGLLLPWLLDHRFPYWPWYVAAPVWLLAAFIPAALLPFYRFWMKLGAVLGWINTRIILGIVFFIVVFPISLMMRMFGNDPMRRRIDNSIDTYRVKRESVPDKKHVERPF